MKRTFLFGLSLALLLAGCSFRPSSSNSSSPSSESSSASSELSSASSEDSSVASSSDAPVMEEKQIKAYRLFNRDNDYLDPDLSDEKYQLGSVTLYFVQGQEYIPYITLDEAAELYGQFFVDPQTTFNSVIETDTLHSWSVAKGEEIIFSSEIDTGEKTFTCTGAMGQNIEGKKDYSKHSINLRVQAEESTVTLGEEREYLVSYADTEFQVINEGGMTYFPFSMIHTFYHELMGHDFFYNYTYLYEYNEVDDLSKANVTDGEDVYTPMEQMSRYIDEHVTEKDAGNKPLMPMYLRKHHRSEFTLVMNEYYGLRNAWGIDKMTDLYAAYGLYEKMVDDNAAVRGAAYSEAFFMLSDNHTGRTILGDNPWVESNGSADVPAAERTAFSLERTLLSNALTDQREKFLKANGFEGGIKDALIYSTDGKTAYFGFDGFEATAKAYRGDGTAKSDEQLASSDSFFYFLKQLRAIAAHNATAQTPVQNVIIDDSLNGGGYVLIMGKLLALLSKDNSAKITTINDINHKCSKTLFRVDSNNDGVYDAQDVYGNTFKFFILTSPISFSCGNAFPIFAQNQFPHVKIIGAKSGGGECVVGENYLSNGMGFVHSSSEHVIVLNEETMTYEGVERGATVDGTIKYNDFYNMDAMVAAINKINDAQ